MTPDRLLDHFDRISDAPDAIPRLRRFILDLAVRGKLVEQDPTDEPATELLKRIGVEKERVVKEAKSGMTESTLPRFQEHLFRSALPTLGRGSLTEWGFLRSRNTASDTTRTFVPMPLTQEFERQAAFEVRPWLN